MVTAQPKLLTYEEYTREGETNWRYDILDGVRVNLPSPTPLHQDCVGSVYELLRAYQRQSGYGRTYQAPFDLEITHDPLRVRQPDVLFISHTRWGNRSRSVPGALETAPELVVEVLSDSDRRQVLAGKLRDFCAIGVGECWTVDTDSSIVQPLRLTPDGPEFVGAYGIGETVTSLTLPGLSIAVADVFVV